MQTLKNLIKILPQSEVNICPIEEFSFDEFKCATKKRIGGLFVPSEEKSTFGRLFDDYAVFRKRIYESNFSFDCQTEFTLVFNYLESLKNLFRFIFAWKQFNAYPLIKDIIKHIVCEDITPVENGLVEIGIRNPIVLESFAIFYLQNRDLEKLKKESGDDTLSALYTELMMAKAERMFRDIIILYDSAFYRIREVKYNTIQTNEISDLRFVAEKEDDLSSIEIISATRMFEKIVIGLDKDKEYRILLVGEVIDNSDGKAKEPTSLSDLKQMIKRYGCKVAIDYFTKKNTDYLTIFSPERLKDLTEIYDKIFILDCPEIYYPITLDKKSDDDSVLIKSQKGIKEILGFNTDTGERDFFNKNGFASVYYRVQNYLLDFTKNNLRKTRKINTSILEWVKSHYPYDEKHKDIDLFEKQAYIYISNNSDFTKELYDKFNFVRVERYNSKDCRIVKYPEPPLPPRDKILSDKKRLTITLYKLLKMLSPDADFYNHVLDFQEKSFVDIFDISKNVIINLNYSPVTEKKIFLNVEACFPYGTPEPVERATEKLIYEMFDFSGRGQINKILLCCYKKAVANVFSGCVDNFNDCLFHHFYLKKLLQTYKKCGEAEVSFKVNNYDVSWFDFTENPYKVKAKAFQYSIKRVAYEMLDKLDSSYCDSKDILEQYINVQINKESIHMYVAGLTNACEVLDYKDSSLFRRLNERLK